MLCVEEEFTQILNFMGIPNDQIRNEASFSKDFDFDESQFICLVLYLDLFFRINVKESEYAEMDTIGRAINLVKKKLEIR